MHIDMNRVFFWFTSHAVQKIIICLAYLIWYAGPDHKKNMEKHEVSQMDTSYNLDKAIPDPNNCTPSQEGSLSLVACKTEVLTGEIIAHQGAGKHASTSINGVVPSEAVAINIEGESGDAIKT